jgi:hypothetical protein
MPYDEEGRFIYPLPARKRKPKEASPDRPKAPVRQKNPKTERLPEPLAFPDLSHSSSVAVEPAAAPTAPATRIEKPLSEGELALVWNAQKWPDDFQLRTRQGQSIEVIYRGRWSGGFGPDFKGAILTISGQLLKGDVELHLKTSGWAEHGHQNDPRYNNVILQVVLEEDHAAPARTRQGTQPQLLVLKPLLNDEAELWQLIESARASGTVLGSISESAGPCCEHVAEHQPDLARLLDEIDTLGQRRFKEKAVLFEAGCAAGLEGGPAQTFWAGLLEALGYSQNKAPFRQLAAALPLATVLELERTARKRSEPFAERVLNLEAVLLGAAGLLPVQRRPRLYHPDPDQLNLFDNLEMSEPLEDWAAGVYVDELERRWNWLERQIRAAGFFAPLKESAWTFARLRPPNHPARRLAGLARLLARWPLSRESELPEWLGQQLDSGATPEESCRQLAATFRAALDDADSESGQFWTRRFDFAPRALLVGDNAKGAAIDLIGPDRAADIVVNIALPFLYGYGDFAGEKELQERALAAYRAHPKLGSNELIENVARQVFRYWLEKPEEVILSGKPLKKVTAGRLIESACRQQGLLFLHQRYCASQDFLNCPLNSNS